MSPFLRDFLDSKKLDRGLRPASLQAYEADLRHFLNWLSSRGLSLEAAQAQDTASYLTTLTTEQGLRPASIARKTSALRQFFRFLVLEKSWPHDPTDQLPTPRAPRRLPRSLTREEVDRLLAAAKLGLPRDHALVLLLYASGLRVSELVGLRLGDVDLRNEVVHVTGKGGHRRIAPFGGAATEALATYLSDHRPRAEGPVFVSETGLGLCRQAVWELLKKLAAQAGIEESKVFPHALRHSFATHLVESGLPLRSLQTLLGHADVTTTQVYTEMSPEHLRRTLELHHPRGGSED